MAVHPEIKLFVYTNNDWTQTPWGTQGWKQARIDVNAYISGRYREMMATDRFIHQPQGLQP